MRTDPAAFLEQMQSTAAEAHVIVKIDDGVTTWLFSDCDMQLTDGHVYPLLVDGITMSQNSDPLYSKRWSVSDVQIALLNADYKNSGVPLADEFDGLQNATVTIYLLAGKRATALSDCATHTVAFVSAPVQYNRGTATITASVLSKLDNITLPQNLISSAFASASDDWLNKTIPLVYGKFTFDGTDFANDENGLAVSIPSTIWGTSQVIADHPLNALSDIWLTQPGIPDLVSIPTRTLTISDGNSRGVATSVSRLVVAYLYPSSDETISDNFNDDVNGDHSDQDIQDVTDRDTTTTSLEMFNNLVTGADPTPNPESLLLLGFDQESFMGGSHQRFKFDAIVAEQLTNQVLQNKVRLYYHGKQDQYIEDNLTFGTTWQTTSTWERFPQNSYRGPEIFAGSGLDDLTADGEYIGATESIYLIIIDGTGTPDTFKWSKDGGAETTTINITGTAQSIAEGVSITFAATTGHTATDQWAIVVRPGRNAPYHYGVWLEGQGNETPWPGGFGDVFQLRLQVQYFVQGDVKKRWAECEGRKYSSWITSRSSNYSDGDVIEDPAGIIESILRDEIGLASGLIDMPTFIAAENTTVKARSNYHSGNLKFADDAIRELAEQSTFAFVRTSDGKARLIDLSDSTPTTAMRAFDTPADAVIPYSQIVEDSIAVSKMTGILNQIECQNQFQQEFNRFYDTTVFDNTTSQATSYGTRKYKAAWKNLAGTSKDHVANHYIRSVDGSAADDDGLWANEHNRVVFQTAGFTNSDIEIGDWIELDATSVDPHIKVFGASWGGKQFLVIGLVQTQNATQIEAIELYG